MFYYPKTWSEYKDSNLGPSAPKADALARLRHTPIKLAVVLGIEPSSMLINSQPLTPCLLYHNKLVPSVGVEPTKFTF